MIKNIESIKSLCSLSLTNIPGIRELKFTDASNVSVLGDIDSGATVYTVAFRNWSGSVEDVHSESAAGDYYTKTATIFVPRYRATCERIVEELVDRRVAVFVKDKNGQDHYLMRAKFQSKFSTGQRSTDSNGYQWTFIGVDRKKRFWAAPTLKELTGDDYTPTAPEIDPIGPAPDDSIPIALDCCVSILSTPIPEPPLKIGNILHLNKFVTVDVTGEKYFIDKDGRSIYLGGAGITKERIEGTGAAIYTLVNLYNPDKVIINRTQNVLMRELSPPPTDIATFNIVADELILPTDWPLEPGEYIEIYQVA